jgi:hypothetical protein
MLNKHELEVFEQVKLEEESYKDDKENYDKVRVGEGVEYPLTLQKTMIQLVNKSVLITL